MFEQFPTLIAPIDNIATVSSTLNGTISTDVASKTVTGTCNFIIETQVGSQLFAMIDGEKTPIGYIGQIIDEHTILLEEDALETVSAALASIDNYKSGYVLGANGFLYPKNSSVKLIADFFTRVKVSERYIQNTAILVPYEIQEGETPELVSYKFYETPFYHWVILICNNIVDPRQEWPLSENQLKKYIEMQYPGQNFYDIYEYRNTETGYVEDYDVEKLAQEIIQPISILEYETEKNEAKRNIRILQPVFINEFTRYYFNAISSPV